MTWLLAAAFFVAAILYSSVGHAGASAYLAVMAFAGVATPVMRPTALVLNLFVATIATWRFSRAGLVPWRTLWPFVLGSTPFAFLGGSIQLPGHWYRTLVGVVLWASAVRLWLNLRLSDDVRRPTMAVAIVAGAITGFLAGLTGTGGGIFLSPLLLFMGWAETRETGGMAAAFILINSAAGLAGNPSSVAQLPSTLPIAIVAVLAGGFIGAELGSRRIGTPTFRRLLGAVLIVAGVKLVFS